MRKQNGAGSEKVEAALETLRAGVTALVSGEQWKRSLEVAAKFHTYSFGNVMLITLQTGGRATRVAGFNRWKELGRSVRKGEKGIAILAPMVRTFEVEDGDGSRRTVRAVRGYRVVYVFDIAQTDGEDLPEVSPVLLEGEGCARTFAALAGIVAEKGFTLSRGDCDGANGVTNYIDRTVRVRADVSDAQALKTLAHEVAHVLMHEPDGDILSWIRCRGAAEVEAESVAFVVLHALGFDTSGYTFPYVAGWSGGDVAAVQKAGDRVQKVAREILATVLPALDPIPA